VFEGDFWGKSVAEFSHSLGQKETFYESQELFNACDLRTYLPFLGSGKLLLLLL